MKKNNLPPPPDLANETPTLDLEIILLDKLRFIITAREIFCTLQGAIPELTDGDLKEFESLYVYMKEESARRERVRIKELPLFLGAEI